MSVEARATNTGYVPATVSGLEVDLYAADAGCFGHIQMPTMNTSVGGARVDVANQQVDIKDKAALLAFVGNVMAQKTAVLELRNGSCGVEALGAGPRTIVYEKTVTMPGMEGPQITVAKAGPAAGAAKGAAAAAGAPVDVVLRVANPSPMEISFGACGFEIRNAAGAVLAELRGPVDIRKGSFDITLQVLPDRVDKTVRLQGKPARLVGTSCAAADWCDAVVKGIDVELRGVAKLLKALGIEVDEEIEEKKEARPPLEKKRSSWLWGR